MDKRRLDNEEEHPDRRHPHRLPDEVYLTDAEPVLITVCVKDDRPLLRGRVAAKAIEVLLARAENAGVTIHAYCAMPTHLHFVATAVNGPPLPAFMRSFKSGASHAINRLGALPVRFTWQRSYHDTHADDDFGAHEQIRYVLDNPVAAGLCERWEDWPTRWFCRGRNDQRRGPTSLRSLRDRPSGGPSGYDTIAPAIDIEATHTYLTRGEGDDANATAVEGGKFPVGATHTYLIASEE